MYELLEKYRDEVSRCVRCGSCQAVCPTYAVTGDESMVARGKLSLIEAVLNGELELTDRFKERMSKCTGCLGCVENCPGGIDPVKIINAARGQFFKDRGSDPASRFILQHILRSERLLYPTAKMIGMLVKYIYNPLLKMRSLPFPMGRINRLIPDIGESCLRNRIPGVVEVKNPRMRVAFFTGCMIDLVYQDTGISIIDILKRSRIELVIPRYQFCCGAPAYYIGDRDTAIFLAENNLDIFDSLEVDAIITGCATCGRMLKDVYRVILGDNGMDAFTSKVVDIHKFIRDNIDHIYSKKSKGDRIKVTYHDPCHLSRGQGVKKPPREILKAIEGVEYIEMEGADKCCGGAGIFNIRHYNLSIYIAEQKVNSIKKTGADIVATGCPSCQMHLSNALYRAGLNIRVMHTVQFLMQTGSKHQTEGVIYDS